MPNDECLKNDEARMTNGGAAASAANRQRTSTILAWAVSSFEIRHSFVIGYFVIRHCQDHSSPKPPGRSNSFSRVAHKPADGVGMKKNRSPSAVKFQPSLRCCG